MTALNQVPQHTFGERLLYWSPRILGILFALFLSMFALDVFGQGGFWTTLVALLMHLIPVYLVLIALGIGWRWEWTGAALFVLLAAVYVATMFITAGPLPGDVLMMNLLALIPVAGPALLIALLFAAHALVQSRGRGAKAQ